MRRFAWLCHGRDIRDILLHYLPLPGAAAVVSAWLGPRIVRRLERRPPDKSFALCSTFPATPRGTGHFVGIGLTAQQMMELPVREVRGRLLRAVRFAQDELGAHVIGLGGLTVSVTSGGEWIAQQPEVRAAVTHGDSYTVALAMAGIARAAEAAELRLATSRVAVVGAYGLIGSALSRLLAPRCGSLVLMGRIEPKLRRLWKEVGRDGVEITTTLLAVREADLVVTATCWPGTLLDPSHLKRGALVYDVAQPPNVCPAVCRARPDIVRIDGALARTPGIDPRFRMGPPRGTMFACLVETMLQALEGDADHHVGPIDLGHVERTRRWGERHGFTHAEFTNFARRLGPEAFAVLSRARGAVDPEALEAEPIRD